MIWIVIASWLTCGMLAWTICILKQGYMDRHDLLVRLPLFILLAYIVFPAIIMNMIGEKFSEIDMDRIVIDWRKRDK